MLNRSSRGLLVGGLVLFVTAGLTGCAEIQKAAEGAARGSGNERLAKTIHGGGTLIGGLLPIGNEEEQTIGQAIALQVIARYGGVYDKPDLTRYVNLVGRSVALTCDRADIAQRRGLFQHDRPDALLRQPMRCGEPADAATCDQDRWRGH